MTTADDAAAWRAVVETLGERLDALIERAAAFDVQALPRTSTNDGPADDPVEAWIADVEAVNAAIEVAVDALGRWLEAPSEPAPRAPSSRGASSSAEPFASTDPLVGALRRLAAQHQCLIETACDLRRDTADAVERLRRGRRGSAAYRAQE